MMPVNAIATVPESTGTGGIEELLRDCLIKNGRLPPDFPNLRLQRADLDRFAALEEHWTEQTTAFGESFQDFATPFIAHAREVVNRSSDAGNYGIYLLESRDGYEGLAHLNAARLPGTAGRSLRVLWALLAPKYDYEDTTPQALARISTALIWESKRLASEPSGPLAAEHIKVHLSNLADRSFFVGIASALQGASELRDVAVRGNWLHLSRA